MQSRSLNMLIRGHDPTTVRAHGEIERVRELTSEQLERDYVAAGRPVIVTDTNRGWPPIGRWSVAYFREMVGARKAMIKAPTNAAHDWYDPPPVAELRSVAEWADRIEGSDPTRRECCITNPLTDYPELLRDAPKPTLIGHVGAHNVRLFAGYNSVTRGHYHPTEQAILCGVAGRKRVILFAPQDFGHVGIAPVWSRNDPIWSAIDFAHPDYKTHPRLAAARPIECIVEPGEMLFIPIHWSHVVIGLGFAMSVTYFWQASLFDWVFPSPGARSVVVLARETLSDGLAKILEKRPA